MATSRTRKAAPVPEPEPVPGPIARSLEPDDSIARATDGPAVVWEPEGVDWTHVGPFDVRRYIHGPATAEHAPYVDGSRWTVTRRSFERDADGPAFPYGNGYETRTRYREGVTVAAGTVVGIQHPSAAPELTSYVLELDPPGSESYVNAAPAQLTSLDPDVLETLAAGGSGGYAPPF